MSINHNINHFVPPDSNCHPVHKKNQSSSTRLRRSGSVSAAEKVRSSMKANEHTRRERSLSSAHIPTFPQKTQIDFDFALHACCPGDSTKLDEDSRILLYNLYHHHHGHCQSPIDLPSRSKAKSHPNLETTDPSDLFISTPVISHSIHWSKTKFKFDENHHTIQGNVVNNPNDTTPHMILELPADASNSSSSTGSSGGLSRESEHPLDIEDIDYEPEDESPPPLTKKWRFDLIQFHFHWNSEHTIGGKGQTMEVHFVHYSQALHRLAVVGVLLNLPTPAENDLTSPLSKIWDAFQSKADFSLDISTFLPTDKSTWAYLGSLTTSPYTEGVLWFILKNNVEISGAEFTFFKKHVKYNARPPQLLHNRGISHTSL